MAYATQQDLEARYGTAELLQVAALPGDRNSAPILDAVRVTQALADTAALIDGYLGKRFVLPVLPVPELLKAIACDIARYKLRNRNEGSGDTSDVIAERNRAAMAQLDKVANGSLLVDGLERQSGSGQRVQFAAPSSVFRREGASLKGWL